MFNNLLVKNFSLFDNITFSFGDKLNILIGENGSGKTQLIKLLYALLRGCMRQEDSTSANLSLKDVPLAIRQNIEAVFHTKMHSIVGNSKKGNTAIFIFSYTEDKNQTDVALEWGLAMSRAQKGGNTQWGEWVKHEPIFVPTHELLTIYPNFISLYDKYMVEYDSTYRNLISSLGMPQLRELPSNYSRILKTITNAINADIYLDDKKNRFYLKQKDLRQKIEIDMAAEGWRRLGMIMQLIRNGSLHSGVSLFWDEPEANLNPKLIRLIAYVIIELSKLGIQIFLATHSLFLVYELELLIAKQKIKEGVRYFNLKKGKPVEQGNTFPELKNVLLVDESIKQTSQYLGEEF